MKKYCINYTKRNGDNVRNEIITADKLGDKIMTLELSGCSNFLIASIEPNGIIEAAIRQTA
jgi:hypothetical protein